MSRLCPDCPGPVGCCLTAYPDDDDHDDRDWQEKIGDLVFLPICWTVVGCLALAISGLLFLVGAWGFTTGYALLR